MERLTTLLIKSSLRDKQFLFWEWIFPIVLFVGFAVFVRGSEYANFILPGLLVFMLFQTLIYAFPLRIAQYKEDGVLRLVVEENSIRLFTSSFLIHRLVLVILQTIIFLPIGILILSPSLSINYLYFILSFLLCLFSLGGLSMLTASLSKTYNSAVGWAQLTYIIFTIISGVFYPIEKSPVFIKYLSYISPLTHSRNAFEYSLNGSGEFPFGSLLFLIVFGFTTLSLSLVVFKKEFSKKGYIVNN